MKIKRILTMFVVVSLAVMSLSGCGKKAPKDDVTVDAPKENQGEKDNIADDQTDDEQIVLRMAWWGSQQRHDGTIAAIEMYEELTGVKIEYEFYDFDNYFTKLNTLVSANDVWDVFQLGGNFPTYIEKIVPLNEYIESGIIDVSNTTGGFLQTTQSEGVQVGMSLGINTNCVAYDPAMFAKAGVPEPTENWTWAEYEAAALKIHEELGIFGSSKFEDFIAGSTVGIPQEELNLNFFAQDNNSLGFDNPSYLVDYIRMRADLVNAGAYPDPGQIAEIKDIEGDYIVSEEAAITWVASNQFIALSEASQRELKLATIPRKRADGPSGMAVQSSQMLSVSKDSKHAEEAAKFIDFFINDIEANLILQGERGVPIMGDVRGAIAKQQTPAQKEVYEFVDIVGTFEVGEVNVLNPTQQPEIKDAYERLLTQAIFGEITPEDAAQKYFDEATDIFNR